jgi:DtxR family transcriptional regulator, Mn-dependent transcriptional regulator
MSESEEMYLISIARLNEAGIDGPVPLSQLAEELDLAPVSVNQMVRKLEEAGLVTYLPYKGAELTISGRQAALRTLRHRRLWEVFLVEELRFSPDEAEELACKMEHVLPDEAADRLATFLGNPVASPQGMPIPEALSQEAVRCEVALRQLKAAETSRVTQIAADTATRTYLSAEGIASDTQITVLAIGGTGAMLLKTENGKTIHLAEEVVKTIWVKAPRQA